MKKLVTIFLLSVWAFQTPFQTEAASTTTKPKAKKSAAKKPAPPPVAAEIKTELVVQAEPTPKPTPQTIAGPSRVQLAAAYNYAYKLYAAKRFEDAKDVFKKIALVSTQPDFNANSLYYYSQCAFRTEDYNGCVKAANILAKKWPEAEAIQKGYLPKFCLFLIDQASDVQNHWDYMRFKERTDQAGNPVWKESIPPGLKIKRVNFKLAFGLYRALAQMNPTDPKTIAAKQRLDNMLNAPITMIWVDEKAPPDKWGHPGDFLSLFSLNEKKDFSKVICERMFFDWKTEKFHQFLEMHDDIRNLKPRFIAKTKQLPTDPEAAKLAVQDPTFSLTLSKLFQVSGYDPFEDSYTSVIETTPLDSL